MVHSHAFQKLGIAVCVLVAVAAITVLASGLLRASADTGGPAGGYTWFDSNNPDPKVTFDPVAISTPDFLSVSGEDDEWSTVDLPFTFNFFGQDYTQVDVSSNGFLSFDIDNPCNDNYNDPSGDDGNTIPVPGDCETTTYWGGEPLIAAWFDDLDPGECGSVRSGTEGEAPNRMFVVQYVDVCHQDCDACAQGEGVTFEVILFEGSNDIKIQYSDTFFGNGDADLTEENRGGTATVGISKDGTTGLQYSANQTVLTDGLAVLFTTGGLPTPTPVPTPTPSPTPEPTPLVQGDVDCNGQVSPVDSLKILRYDAGLGVTQEQGCTPIGSDLPAQ